MGGRNARASAVPAPRSRRRTSSLPLFLAIGLSLFHAIDLSTSLSTATTIGSACVGCTSVGPVEGRGTCPQLGAAAIRLPHLAAVAQPRYMGIRAYQVPRGTPGRPHGPGVAHGCPRRPKAKARCVEPQLCARKWYMYPTFDSAAGSGEIPVFFGILPYLILRVTWFDSASGPIPGNGPHWGSVLCASRGLPTLQGCSAQCDTVWRVAVCQQQHPLPSI